MLAAAGLAGAQMFAQMFGGSVGTPIPAVAWYKLDGNALDSSGNGYNGTWNGEAAYSAGVSGSAADYSGGNYTTIGKSSVFIPSANAPITVSFWFKPGSIGAAQLSARMLAVAESSSASAMIVGLGNNNQLQYFNGGSVVSSGATITAGAWRHVACAYNGTYTRFYVDGITTVSVTNAMSSGSAEYNSVIGAGFTGSQRFTGLIDDVRIYSRALSTANIQRIMTGQTVEPIEELQ